MITGKVVRFDEVRGYGFLTPDSGGEDVFVHANALSDEKYLFTPGTPVEFEVAEGERGLKASAVRVIGKPQGPVPSVHPVSATSGSALSSEHPDEEDGLCDVLSPAGFVHELTETLIETVPNLTGGQIVQLRQQLVKLARRHGWVEG